MFKYEWEEYLEGSNLKTLLVFRDRIFIIGKNLPCNFIQFLRILNGIIAAVWFGLRFSFFDEIIIVCDLDCGFFKVSDCSRFNFDA
jgi:hypothetical protein